MFWIMVVNFRLCKIVFAHDFLVEEQASTEMIDSIPFSCVLGAWNMHIFQWDSNGVRRAHVSINALYLYNTYERS